MVIEDNLLDRRLSPAGRADFDRAAGRELGDPKRPTMAPGLSALLSSAALVYNVFDYWRDRDLSPLAAACGADVRVMQLVLEETFPLWRGGTPPHLDVVLTGPSGVPTAIEAKFTEPYGRVHNALRETYFELERNRVWSGLSGCREIADRIRDGDASYTRLGVAQLIKHVLGLSRRYGRTGFRLLYLWYEEPGEEASLHRAEIERFRKLVGGEIVLGIRTYQEVFGALRMEPSVDPEYVRYLADRYFVGSP
jgi:hypothetical protein